MSEAPDRTKDKDSYAMDARCTNCGWRGTQSFSKGIKANDTHRECPKCGCLATLHFSPIERVEKLR